MPTAKLHKILILSFAFILALCGANSDSNASTTHPGHYVIASPGIGSVILNQLANNPNVKGVSITYNWVDLETSRDVYDFTAIENDLALLQPLGKQLIVMIQDKSFSNNPFIPVPDYMLTAVFSGGYSASNNGMMAKRWIHAVSDRYRALIAALGARFDQEPNFEAIKTSETATGEGHLDYNAMDYVAELMLNIEALATAFPSTTKLLYINWLPGAQGAIPYIIDHANTYGVGIGGPDVHPDVNIPAYPYYPMYAGLIPLMVDVQWDNYDHVTPAGDTKQLFDFATTNLNVNYICWQPRSPYQLNLLSTINTHPTF